MKRTGRSAGWMRFLLGTLLLLCLLGMTPASAEEAEPFDPDAAIGELLDESGADELFSLLPEEGQALLSGMGVEEVSQETLLNLSFWNLLQSGWNSVQKSLTAPLTLLMTSVGVILLCALLQSLQSSFQSQAFERVFSTVSALCISGVIIAPVAELIRTAAERIETMSDFFAGFIPVYTGIITALGKPVSAMAYNTGVMGVAQVISRIAGTVLVPLLGIYLAFCLIGGASKEIRVAPIARTVQTVVITVLTFLLTVFVGLLSVQSVIASSADTVTMRTAKFAVGTFLPVVGSALSDALSTMQGCMEVVRSTVGGFGIVAIAAAFLPPVISVLLMKLALAVAGGVGDVLGTEQASGLLRAASSALTLILGLLLVFAMLFIISISIMLALAR